MHCHSFCALLLTAAVLSTALTDPRTPTTVICNAYRHPIICTIAVQPGSETPASTRKYSIHVGSCFSTSDIVQGLHIERPVVTRPPLDAVQGLYIERPAVTRAPPVPLARRFPGAIHNEGKQQGSQPSAQSTQLALPPEWWSSEHLAAHRQRSMGVALRVAGVGHASGRRGPQGLV
jgi:hypothetical protein